MTNFYNIKQEWASREFSEPEKSYKSIIEKTRKIQTRQIISQVVLSVTAIILIGFFFYVSAYTNSRATLGLLLMIGSLLLRIIIEIKYKLDDKKIDFSQSAKVLHQKLVHYHKIRLAVNYILSPILFATYIIGFVLLLPVFKANLSEGFYTYVQWSSFLIFVFLALFICYQIRKELRELRYLKTVFET
ncbi:MAG TPA: hypothetical protein VFC92_10545 [Bacteroidales bacterium]|nr:hypothetical protein [Bacteroidales bacterium]